MYTHQENVVAFGPPLEQTGKALIMLHGRGATADDILSLRQHLAVADFTLFAPQASRHSWYPYSFMAPVSQNQPALDSALDLLATVVNSIRDQGLGTREIYLLGFSQGACLTAEYASRNAQHYGGVICFTGGLIGQQLSTDIYKGDFHGTPVLITTGDPDPHVPVSRVEESAGIMTGLGAQVTKKIYKGRPHTILPQELELANQIFSQPRERV
ncbi:MAG: alpha/beta hydrolase [Adhaeribacter sp.]